MEFSAKQIAELVGGTVEGNSEATVNTFCKIEDGRAGAISFLSNPKYTHYLYETKSSIVLVNADLQLERPVAATLIRVANAYESVAKLLQLYESMKPKKSGIDPLAFVSPTAKLGTGCYPQASIYYGCRIGNNVIMHSGSVVGADGFGFAPNANGYDKIPQIGIVTIEDNVEIGANTCIDRSTMGSTFVRKGVKLDNLVQIAHNTDIGANTVMSSQVGVAGSTKVGEWCMFGGQVGISGHITIGDKVFLGAQSGVPSSLESNQKLIGTPPQNQVSFFKQVALMRRLPDMQKTILQLQKEIDELKKNLSINE